MGLLSPPSLDGAHSFAQYSSLNRRKEMCSPPLQQHHSHSRRLRPDGIVRRISNVKPATHASWNRTRPLATVIPSATTFKQTSRVGMYQPRGFDVEVGTLISGNVLEPSRSMAAGRQTYSLTVKPCPFPLFWGPDMSLYGSAAAIRSLFS